MTQLPRIGDPVCEDGSDDTWTVYGTTEDHTDTGSTLRAVLLKRGPQYSRITADEYRQHWTPATQRNA
jgi:hypothetical protein